MIRRIEYLERFWEPYLLSEREFLSVLEYVALRECNLGACSERLIRSLFISCSLFESLVKAIYGLNEGSISQYKAKMIEDSEFVPNLPITVLRGEEGLTISPFSSLCNGESPKWWRAYTDLKHNRAKHFEEGNLENALDALGGAYYLALVYIKRIGDYWYERLPYSDENCIDVPNDVSHLFKIDDFETRRHQAGYNSYFASNEDIEEIINEIRK